MNDTETTEQKNRVRSLWIPLRNMNLLVPNVAVAEIGSYRVPESLPNMPDWFLGLVKWRETTIPVISLESVCGMEVSSDPVFSRLMVLNSVRAGSPVQHYAIVTAGLPGLVQFGSETADGYQPYNGEGLQGVVYVGSEVAAIPDFDYLQKLLEQHLEQAA